MPPNTHHHNSSESTSFDLNDSLTMIPMDIESTKFQHTPDAIPLIPHSTSPSSRPITTTSSPISPSSTRAQKRLALGITICFTFFLIELAGGLYSNSLALVADSFHLLTDAAAYTVSFVALWIARKRAGGRFTFGFKRAEVLGALISVLLIWALVLALLKEATERVLGDPEPINATMMLPLAIAGLVVNIILINVFGLDDHHHHHSKESKTDSPNINLRAAILHAMGDLVCSIGVVLSSIAIILKPSWQILDPICTFLFSFVVLFTTFRIIRDIVLVFMEATPAHVSPVLPESLHNLPHIKSIHATRIWCLTTEYPICTAHIVVYDKTDAETRDLVLKEAGRIVQEAGIKEWTFQIESESEGQICVRDEDIV
ncbi:cation diffusion facilitator family transporter [Spizellomyces punctatus DAOM BR117]|uniref:Cation diffusion facilitator family transporter n=1 Tax=Spizellomyces punctatus (strain DAOM BR117) TaxID=645134 RepID=A0A0L0H7N4_SPIPD|nr:cation diffusion facilitator family transporter [Spizellomyces punctatus DAOM BR117]KNC96911.1 cation diffusion facilitator family transporter [Spizellomyces punctatus DAOM BR117]|eukprot:XP_016604951.1 cation diffusion facilitator family transporter [Spizellomyces punctatus DAOM BR117]